MNLAQQSLKLKSYEHSRYVFSSFYELHSLSSAYGLQMFQVSLQVSWADWYFDCPLYNQGGSDAVLAFRSLQCSDQINLVALFWNLSESNDVD